MSLTWGMVYVVMLIVALSSLITPQVVAAQTAETPNASPEESPLDGITFGVGFDGYYAWNTNRPIGRINLLRAYDVSSDSFSLNQANVIVERAPDVEKGRRMGLRLDLM